MPYYRYKSSPLVYIRFPFTFRFEKVMAHGEISASENFTIIIIIVVGVIVGALCGSSAAIVGARVHVCVCVYPVSSSSIIR